MAAAPKRLSSQEPIYSVGSPFTRQVIVAEFRTLAILAEANGDTFVAAQALKCAWRIERLCPVNPVPASLDETILLAEAIARLMRRFLPQKASRLATDIAKLRQRQLERATLQSEIATLH